MSQAGTPNRAIEWARRNIGAGVSKIAKWDRQAGFGGERPAWCGIFLGAAMRAQGLRPPSGYASAINWSKYGNGVRSLSEARPGDVLVYGHNHVAMYLGGGRQIQGNNSSGTVGESGVGSSIGLGPITAIRRPPYRAGSSGGGILNDLSSFLQPNLPGTPGGDLNQLDINPLPDAGEIANQVVGDLVGAIAGKASPLMLNVGLIGGGAFLAYYGIALMAGVQEPGLKLLRAGRRGAEAGAVAA